MFSKPKIRENLAFLVVTCLLVTGSFFLFIYYHLFVLVGLTDMLSTGGSAKNTEKNTENTVKLVLKAFIHGEWRADRLIQVDRSGD